MIDFARYKEAEFLKPAEAGNLQRSFLRKHLNHLLRNSPYYKKILQETNVDVEKVEIETLADLPFTDKSDIEKNNDEFIAVPMSKVSDIVTSSGTTGKPTKVIYTENDLIRLSHNEEISFRRCGITEDDVVLLACTMDRCFIAGLAYFLGVRNIGAAAVRSGNNSFGSHLEIIRRLNPTVIVAVPSFLRKLGLFLESEGIDPGKTSVKKMICIGEPIRDKNLSLLKIGDDLEKMWGAKIFSTYASTEMVTTFCECTQQQGGHFSPSLAVVEIVDNKGNVLPYGETGEIVVTPLLVEGMPLLRFKTGDISFLLNDPCACGRFSPRMGPILGRKEQMIKYQGTTFYPMAIYSILDETPEVSEYYIVVSNNFDLSDDVTVYVSMKNDSCSTNGIMEKLQSRLRVKPKVIISPDEEVRKHIYPKNSRKPVRFIDRRKPHNEML